MTCVIQPGGSIRDAQVIEAADYYDMANDISPAHVIFVISPMTLGQVMPRVQAVSLCPSVPPRIGSSPFSQATNSGTAVKIEE